MFLTSYLPKSIPDREGERRILRTPRHLHEKAHQGLVLTYLQRATRVVFGPGLMGPGRAQPSARAPQLACPCVWNQTPGNPCAVSRRWELTQGNRRVSQKKHTKLKEGGNAIS